MGKFTVIPQNTFDALQLDAGVILKRFNPANPVEPADEDIVCATTGGVNPSCVPEYTDLGEDVDNVPNNMMELKKLTTWNCALSTTSLGTSPELIKLSLGCADIDENTSAIIPRADLKQTDFSDLWWVGDKANGGFVAVQIKNALSTGGFSLQTTKNGKGTIGLQITGHVSIKKQKEVPMVFYSIDADDPDDPSGKKVTMSAESGDTVMFGTPVSDMQTGVSVENNAVTGTLKYLSDGQLVDAWGAGNFLAVKFAAEDWSNHESVKVGLRPTYPNGGDVPVDDDSGLVEIINDPDKNGAFKITDKATQKFKIVADGVEKIYDLSGLTVEENPGV